MNLLILSTLPHYLAVIPTNDIKYRIMIITSTTFSVLWHWYNEEEGLILLLDYFFALIWLLYEIRYSLKNNELFERTILLNSLILYLNLQIKYNEYYIYNHSIWHLLSALKSYYLAKSFYNVAGQ